MAPSTLKVFAAVAVVACTCGRAAPVCAQNPDGVTLDGIARRLEEWRASFVNVRVVWELRSLPKTDDAIVDWPAPPNPDSSSAFARHEWIWADHGLDLFEDWSLRKEGTAYHSIDVFNGPNGIVFRASYRQPPQESEEFTALLLRGLNTGKPTSLKSRTAMNELYWPGSASRLPEMLARWEWSLEGIEEIGGEPCARIVATQPEVTDASFVEILWLDLGHGCLVKRHRSPPVEERRRGTDFIVDEFQQLENGIWFPKRGRIRLGSTPHENQMFVVTEAAVNQTLDLARFEPPAPEVGTAIDDGHGRSYRYGVSPAPPDEGATTNGSGEPTSHAPVATPPAFDLWRWSGVLLGIAVALLLAGLWFQHRAK